MVYITNPIPSLTIENGKVKTYRKIGFTDDSKGIKKRLSFPQSFLDDPIVASRSFYSKSVTSKDLESKFHEAFKQYHHNAKSHVRELYDVDDDQIDAIITHLKTTVIPDLEEIRS